MDEVEDADPLQLHSINVQRIYCFCFSVF